MSTEPTALVVDDESMVRQLVRRMLEPELCRVVEAPDAEAALALIGRTPAAIDVVVTDLVMPGLDGLDLLQVLSTYVPDLPVVCMSGFTSAPPPYHPQVPLLTKPFTETALRSIVAAALGQGGARQARTVTPAVDLVRAAREARRARELRDAP